MTKSRRIGGGGKVLLLLTSLLTFFNTCRLVVSRTTQPLVPLQPSRSNDQSQRQSFLIGKRKVPTSSWASRIALQERLRGGATSDNDEEEYDSDVDDEYDEEDVNDDEEDEYDEDEDEYDEEEEEEDSTVEQLSSKSTSSTEYDEPYFMNPTMQLYTTFGIMMLGRKVDLFSPAIVQLIRFAFVAQILIQQIFIIYVRIMAKKNNDRTPVTTQNPLSGVLQSQLGGNNDDGGGGGSAMMKNLASSFLSSQTTVMEYDMQQAKSMQSGVIFNMIFMWFLHFRMEQVQPLLIQATTGIMQLLYNPLFQVYILGRNLERPFKNPAMDARKKMMESRAAAAAEDTGDDEETAEKEVSDEEDEDGEDEDGESDEEMVDDEEEVEDSDSETEDEAKS